jgi:hypothetical protein
MVHMLLALPNLQGYWQSQKDWVFWARKRSKVRTQKLGSRAM